MALEQTNTATGSKKDGMWHPHVYGTPPKCPTPFSIDDILRHRQQQQQQPSTVVSSMTSEMAARFSAEEWFKVCCYLNSAMQHQKQQLIQTSTSEESGRDSIQSTPPNTGDEAEAESQPLNLSLATNHKDPFDHEFLEHKAGKLAGSGIILCTLIGLHIVMVSISICTLQIMLCIHNKRCDAHRDRHNFPH